VKVTAQIRYPASCEAVFAMLVDSSFQERVCEATGAVHHEVTIERDGAAAVITTRRELPTDDIPEYARGFVGRTLDVVRVDRWEAPAADGSREGTISLEVQGAPIRLRGTLALRPDDGGCEEAVAGELKASVPLLGGRMEKAAEPALMSAIRKEEQVGLLQLGG
jgi:hypothetical protein